MARWQLVVLSLAAVCLFAHVCSGTTIKSKAQLKDTPPYAQSDLNTMLNFYQTNVDVNNLGYTVAAQSQQNPNYWFHWVRDAAISMDKLRPWVSSAAWDTHMQHYTKWVLQVVAQSDPNGIDIRGEPKFFIPSGQVYNLPWGRPQNDGPALRAIVLMEYAQWLISQGRQSFVTQYLWVLNSMPPNDGAIKNDLEYVSHNWQNDCFDPWEEVNGNHFFTRMVQRKALIMGAALGSQLGDTQAAAYYQQQAQAIEPTISAHWNPSTNVLMETMPPHNNPQKYDEIDTAVLLGVLYGYNNDNFYAPGDSQVLSTLSALQSVFSDGSFPINGQDTKNGVPGVLFGRYPNDTYDGVATNAHGNPWILCTNAVGEIFYREASAVAKGLELTQERLAWYKRVIKRTTLNTNHATEAELRDHLIAALVDQGDDYLLRVRYHIVGGGLHMAEELDRNTGFETGAADLTWSYATVFSAMAERGNAFN